MSSVKNKIIAGDTTSYKGGSIDGGRSGVLGDDGSQARDGMSVTSKKVNMGQGARMRKFKKDAAIYGMPVKKQGKLNSSMDHLSQSTQKLQIDADELERTQQKKQENPCEDIILTSEQTPVQMFVFTMIIFALLSSLLAAFFACFGPPDDGMLVFDHIMEVCFGIDMCRYFLMQYIDEDDQKPVRNLRLIAKRYLKGDFIVDLLAISPILLRELVKDSWAEDERDLLFLLRLLRLQKVFFLLDQSKFQALLKKVYNRSINAAIEDYPDMHPMREDKNKIMQQIYIMYIFRVVRLVLFILILSYFLGTIWFIISMHTTDREQQNPPDFSFYNEYALAEKTNFQNLVIVIYYAFTTLSTVGFGDFNPKSEVERIVTIIVLLLGVASFSYIMGQFIDILVQLQSVNADNEDSETLSKWLGLLAHFNKSSPLPKALTKRYERYFEYYWANDKNYATKQEADLRFMAELPNHIQNDIYMKFLFYEFLNTFTVPFRMRKPSLTEKPDASVNLYNWEDSQYSQFMISMLQSLEPRFYSAQEYIFEEGDEVNEQIYVIANQSKQKGKSGKYAIGFSDQKQRYFHVKLGKKTIIGGYENLFGKKSEFFYKALHHVDAYGLRKEQLKPIMDKYPEFKSQISAYTVNFYYRIIKKPMLEFKKNILSQVRKRQDMDNIMQDVEKQIVEADKEFNEDFNKSYEQESSKNDETERNVKKLKNKVNNLAKSVHDLFLQFDGMSQRAHAAGQSPLKSQK